MQFIFPFILPHFLTLYFPITFSSPHPVLTHTHSSFLLQGSLLDYSESIPGGAYDCTSQARSSHKSGRQPPLAPEKILDAPTLVDDYCEFIIMRHSHMHHCNIRRNYFVESKLMSSSFPPPPPPPPCSLFIDLNNLDWGKSNLLAIGLGSAVYLWNANTGSVNMLMEMKEGDDYVSSVSWSRNGKFLAIGESNATIQLWDVEKEKKIRSMRGHTDRVAALSWNKHTLTRYSMR